MSDRGFTEIFIQGNWHHLTGTGNRRSKSWSQTAITRRTLQVYLPEAVTMRNLIQIFCLTCLFSTVLLYQHSSPVLSTHILLCSLHAASTMYCHVNMPYLFLHLTYSCTLNFNYLNQRCVSPRAPRPDATWQRGPEHITWIGRIELLRPTCAKLATNCPYVLK